MTMFYTYPEPDNPSFACDTCGRDLDRCACPGGADHEYRAAWREWVRNGDLDAPEDGDAIYAAGFERVLEGEGR